MFSFFQQPVSDEANATAVVPEKSSNGKSKRIDHKKYIALALAQNKKNQDTTQNSESSSSEVLTESELKARQNRQKIDPLVDDVIHTYTARSKSGANARVKVLIPAADDPLRNPNASFAGARTFRGDDSEDEDHDDDPSDYSSAASQEEDDNASFVSAAQSAAASIRSRLSLFRRKGKKNKKRKENTSPQRLNADFDDKSVGGDQSVRSNASSVFGLSVSSLSVRKLINRRKKNRKSREIMGGRPRSILKRSLNSAERSPEFSVDGDCTGSNAAVKLERRRLPELLSLTSTLERDHAVVSPTPSNSKSTDSLEDSDDSNEEVNVVLDDKGDAPPGTPPQLNGIVRDAISKSGSVSRLDIPDFEPRLEDPEEPLLDALGQTVHTPSPEKKRSQQTTMHIIDPLDMEFFLKDVGEANRDSEFFEEDDVSSLSLSSCSSLSVSSTPMANDDYGVYEKKAMPSSSSYCAGDRHGKSARMTSILHGDISGPAVKNRNNTANFGAYEMPSSMQIRTTRTVSLLLLDPVLKIFEIVQVVCSMKTTLEEVLEKAKAAAVDDTLAKQKYTGLCNDSREAVSPNALVLRLAPRSELKVFASFTMSDKEMKQAMERHLLVAVPESSTAVECQKIRRMLWKNPKLQAWWHATIQLRQNKNAVSES